MSRAAVPPPRSLRILVVEDDDDHAELILHGLERHAPGHRVTRVADGAEALAFLDAHRADADRPDLVILDLNLPRVGGLDVLEQVKRDAELRLIPVVVLTTSDAESDRVRAYASHVNSYLVKPVSYVALEALLADLGEYWGKWNLGV